MRLPLVEPNVRGLGIGRGLVDACIAFARAAGYRKISLWTQQGPDAARRIYENASFCLTNEEPHYSFGQDLVGETWEFDL
ncbi:MAG: GNAT family N-acetyltransferase [Betaproteobacteria bacterium]